MQILQSLKRTARQMAYKSVVYNWSLNNFITGAGTPQRLLVKPVDPWPGNADAGKWLCNGAFMMDGEQLNLRGECWEPLGVDGAWLNHMHGFTWLRDLRTVGGDLARGQGRAMIESWIRHYKSWDQMAWRPALTGERIAMWISSYETFAASADDIFLEAFYDSLIRQARHLSRALPGEMAGIDLLKAIKGLLYAGLAFEGYEPWIEQSLSLLEKEINKQILGDGSHASRNAEQLLEALQIFLDIKNALRAGGYPLPEKVQHAIDRMGPALRFFRYGDKHFGLFNGSQEGNQELVDAVLGQAQARGRGLQSLPCGGYERVSLGRTLLMFDYGRSPAFPYEKEAHAAPLAFEFSYGKDRLFVNCGTHPTSEEWKDSLRATAAHSTLTIDHRNACEIRGDGHFARKVKNVSVLREDTKNACLVEASHDGYMQMAGITHRRRLYLTNQGHDLRGEDTLTCSVGINRPLDVAVRFHIHPRVLVSLIREGEEALLRMPCGTGWRFHISSGLMALEDSVYLGEGGRPRKTKQLVIYGRMSEDFAQIKWALQREG
jgi:uncharacterized heparinase superfamily protein